MLFFVFVTFYPTLIFDSLENKIFLLFLLLEVIEMKIG